jgi:hypothetical protein
MRRHTASRLSALRSQRTCACADTLCARTGRSQQYPAVLWRVGQARPEAYNPDMYAVEKSDNGIVPVKVSNKTGSAVAEMPEERPLTKGKFWI